MKRFLLKTKFLLITPEAQPVIHRIPDNDVLKNHAG